MELKKSNAFRARHFRFLRRQNVCLAVKSFSNCKTRFLSLQKQNKDSKTLYSFSDSNRKAFMDCLITMWKKIKGKNNSFCPTSGNQAAGHGDSVEVEN